MNKVKEYLRKPGSLIMLILILLAVTITVASMIYLVIYILVNGIPYITPDLFAWKYNTENVSMTPAIINTIIMVFLTLLLAVPIGIAAAIYLVEYSKRNSKLVKVIRLTTETLAGIPSIVFGLFGFIVFVLLLKWGNSLLAGVLTLTMMVLPTIVRTTEESLLAVPDMFREGSYGLGAGKLRTIFVIVLPAASRNTIGSNSCHWTNCRRKCSSYIYSRNSGRSAKESVFIYQNPGGTYVFAVK